MTTLFELQTINSNLFKQLFEGLKEIIMETKLEFNSNGIRTSTSDKGNTIGINLFLNREKFCIYKYQMDISIGINVYNIYTILKSCNNEDILIMTIEGETNIDDYKLILKFKNEKINKLVQYDIDNEYIDHNDIKYDKFEPDIRIEMPSNEFHKIFRDMNNFKNSILDKVSIKCVDYNLIIEFKSDKMTQKYTFSKDDNNIITFNYSDDKKSKMLIFGNYLLKNLTLFSKCANISKNLKLYLKKENSLVLEYQVGILGELKLILSQYYDDKNDDNDD